MFDDIVTIVFKLLSAYNSLNTSLSLVRRYFPTANDGQSLQRQYLYLDELQIVYTYSTMRSRITEECCY